MFDRYFKHVTVLPKRCVGVVVLRSEPLVEPDAMAEEATKQRLRANDGDAKADEVGAKEADAGDDGVSGDVVATTGVSSGGTTGQIQLRSGVATEGGAQRVSGAAESEGRGEARSAPARRLGRHSGRGGQPVLSDDRTRI